MTRDALTPFGPLYGVALDDIRQHRGLYLAIGIGLVILGVLALGASVFATLLTVTFIGWLLIVSGIVLAAHAFWTRSWRSFFLHLLGAVLDVVVGLLLVANPAVGALTLTLLLAAFFLVGGIFRIVGASVVHFPGWGWVLFSGVVTTLLGILIWAQWPASGLWVIGTFVGIDLLLRGWSFIMLTVTAGHESRLASV